MIVFRLSRTGKKKQPYFRIVVQDKQRDPWSPAIEIVGNLNPRLEKQDAVLNKERIAYWLSKGAQPSPTVHNLFVDLGIMQGEKVKHTRITAKRAKKIAEKASKAE
ncbi:30S ribosomal protein S16 [bacterium]|jgi:small subunit ribosomal protein S16|nr:30S ribosomal protein S16 [bacterium]